MEEVWSLEFGVGERSVEFGVWSLEVGRSWEEVWSWELGRGLGVSILNNLI